MWCVCVTRWCVRTLRGEYIVGRRPPGTPLKAGRLCLLRVFRLGRRGQPTRMESGRDRGFRTCPSRRDRVRRAQGCACLLQEVGLRPLRAATSAFRGHRHTLPVGPRARRALPVPAEVGVRAPAPPLSGPSPRGRGPAPALQAGRAEPGAHGAVRAGGRARLAPAPPAAPPPSPAAQPTGCPSRRTGSGTRASGRGAVALRSAVPLCPARAARLPQAPSPAFLWTDAQTPAGE